MKHWKIAIVVLAWSVTLVFGAAARADLSNQLLSCGDGVPYVYPWAPMQASDGFVLDDDCAGVGLKIINPGAAPNALGIWLAELPREDLITSYQFTVSGGDTTGGVRYMVLQCNGPDRMDCDLLDLIGDRDGSSTDQNVSVVNAGAGGKSAGIAAVCTREDVPCDADSDKPLTIRNIMVVRNDLSVPLLKAEVMGVKLDESAALPWTNAATIPVRVVTSDDGSGVDFWRVTVGSTPPISSRFELAKCGGQPEPDPSTCHSEFDPSALFDLRAIGDGIFPLTVDSVDHAGNASDPQVATLRVDRTPPAPPATLSVTPTESGWPGSSWSPNPVVGVHWPAPSVPDPTSASPLTETEVLARQNGVSVGTTRTVSSATTELDPLNLGSDGQWQIAVNFTDEAGNKSAPTARTVGIDGDSPDPAAVTSPGLVSRSSLVGGRQIAWQTPSSPTYLESGVCGYWVEADPSPGTIPNRDASESISVPTWRLPANLADGINWVHVRTVSCAGVGSTTTHVPFTVDGTPPQLQISGLPNEGTWSNTPVLARLVARDAISGVRRVGYALDGAALAWHPSDQLQVPVTEGVHTLRTVAEDVAGNRTEEQVFVVSQDTEPPAVQLEPGDANDPTQIIGRVQDRVSGVSNARFELRRVDSAAAPEQRDWSSVGPAQPIEVGSTASSLVSLRLDDAVMPAGDYEIRINARDVAGNSSAAVSQVSRSLQMPLRRSIDLSAAIADVKRVCRTRSGRKCAAAKRCAEAAGCRYIEVVDRTNAKRSVVRSWKQPTALVGELLSRDGDPVTGAPLAIEATTRDGVATTIGHVTTNDNGRYSFPIPRGPSRTFTVRFAGDASRLPVADTAKRATRTELSFRLSKSRLRSGHTLGLSGKVLHAKWLPVGGVTVSFQFETQFGWWSTGEDVMTASDGSFSYNLPWAKRPTRSWARIRARVSQPPSGWPFEPGVSAARRVVVLPSK